MTDPTVTHFRRERSESVGGQWHWITQTPSGEVVGAGQKGHRRLDNALREFIRQRSHPDWVPDAGMFAMPPGYSLHKRSPDHYVVISAP